MKTLSLFLFALGLAAGTAAQIRKIPAIVTETFSRQYPDAKDVAYRDQLTGYQVSFLLDSSKMLARYSNKGEWKETEKEWHYDQLPSDVRDGFDKSKYAGAWKVTETSIITEPGGVQTYRLKVEKNEVQKKYLYYDRSGRLIRDNITL